MKKLFTVLGLVFLLTLGSIGGVSATQYDYLGATWNVSGGYENILLNGVGLVTINPACVLETVDVVNSVTAIDTITTGNIGSVQEITNVTSVDTVDVLTSITNTVNVNVDNASLTVIKPTVTVAHTDPLATSVSGTLIATNSARVGLIIQNDDDTDDIYISLDGGVAAALNTGIRINNTGGSWVMSDSNLYTGTITVISDDTGAGSEVLVTEF